MPGPAARIGDQTVHGGVVVGPGVPNVLIGGMPASVVGDMHMCPLVTPGTPPIPHVGGPITSPGTPTVLIGGRPAATIGSLCTCVGPPDSVIMGAPTVLLGTAGSGAGSAGSGGGAGTAGANASAASAAFDNLESVTKEEHWIDFQFVDAAGNPVSGVPYRLEDPDGRISESVLRLDGRIVRDAVSDGEGEAVVMSVHNAQWSAEEAKVGEKVSLSADVAGFDAGSRGRFQIYRREDGHPDVMIDQIPAEVEGDTMKAEWVFRFDPESIPDEVADGYRSPVFYFDAMIGPCSARSGMLRYDDILRLKLLDEEGNAVPNEPYVVYLANGEVIRGELDANGTAEIKKAVPGACRVTFPNQPHVTGSEEPV